MNEEISFLWVILMVQLMFSWSNGWSTWNDDNDDDGQCALQSSSEGFSILCQEEVVLEVQGIVISNECVGDWLLYLTIPIYDLFYPRSQGFVACLLFLINCLHIGTTSYCHCLVPLWCLGPFLRRGPARNNAFLTALKTLKLPSVGIVCEAVNKSKTKTFGTVVSQGDPSCFQLLLVLTWCCQVPRVTIRRPFFYICLPHQSIPMGDKDTWTRTSYFITAPTSVETRSKRHSSSELLYVFL